MESPSDHGTDEGAVAWALAGRAFVRGRLQPVEVGIDEDGWIRAVRRTLRGVPHHDVGDRVLLPSATDLHVHFRDPGGPEEVESFATGTVQAALGGVGLVGDMPNGRPAVTDVDHLEAKAARVRGRAAVDVLLYAAPTEPRALDRLARRAGACKIYLRPPTGGDDVPSASELPVLLERLAALDLPVSVHAEDPTAFRRGAPAQDALAWNAERPVAAELEALERLLPGPPRLRLHVAHVTTAEAAGRIRSAGASFEASPHHLLLSARSGGDPRFKVNPPLRSEAERAGLWEAFRRGEVPCLASDHAPHPREAKELPFAKAPSGVPGVQTMLPLLLAKVRAGKVGLTTVVGAASDRPARWLGQPAGRVAAGHRANLLVVDFRARSRVSARRLEAPCGWTPFEGQEAIFPEEHYHLGERIVEGGQYVGRPSGNLVRPEFARSASRGARTTAASA